MTKSGATIWAASVIFGDWALRVEPELFRGKRVLELGSGVGVAGAAICSLVSQLTLSDYDTEVVQCLHTTVDLNMLQNTQVELVDWCTPLPDEIPFQEQYDVIVGWDVLYEPEAMSGLIKFLIKQLRP